MRAINRMLGNSVVDTPPAEFRKTNRVMIRAINHHHGIESVAYGLTRNGCHLTTVALCEGDQRAYAWRMGLDGRLPLTLTPLAAVSEGNFFVPFIGPLKKHGSTSLETFQRLVADYMAGEARGRDDFNNQLHRFRGTTLTPEQVSTLLMDAVRLEVVPVGRIKDSVEHLYSLQTITVENFMASLLMMLVPDIDRDYIVPFFRWAPGILEFMEAQEF